MPTFKITLAYDGTGFVGWQRQQSGTSIQGLLEAALRELDEHDVAVVGAGRTDAGVHAFGQVASFRLDRFIEGEILVRALNARLPAAVRVLDAARVPDSFHARFGAKSKTYRYRIWNADILSPFERCYAWHVPGRLDRKAMGIAAGLLEGRHDFAAFRAAGGSPGSTEREVYSSRVVASIQPCAADFPRPEPASAHEDRNTGPGPGAGCDAASIAYEITGSGFLRHMVRTIVGTLVEIGRGRQPIDWMRDVLAGRSRAGAGPTAPPHGLVLVSVQYDASALATER